MIHAKQLTETSWMIRDSRLDKSLGIVHLKEQKFRLFGKNIDFDSLDDVAKHFGGKLLEEENDQEQEAVTNINGFEIKHSTACEFESIEINGITLQTYKVKQGSKKTLVAGRFGIVFPNGIVSSFCPILKTLQENKFIGPYTSKFELQFYIRKYNNEHKLGD